MTKPPEGGWWTIDQAIDRCHFALQGSRSDRYMVMHEIIRHVPRAPWDPIILAACKGLLLVETPGGSTPQQRTSAVTELLKALEADGNDRTPEQ